MEKLRPLTFFFSCLALIAAVTAAVFLRPSALWETVFAASLFFLALLFCILYRRAGRKTGFFLCLFLALFASAGLFSHLLAVTLPRQRILSRGEGTGDFTVLSVSDHNGEEDCLCYLHTLDGTRIGGKVLLSFSYRPGLSPGEHIRVRAAFSSPEEDPFSEGTLALGDADTAIPLYGEAPFSLSLAVLRLRSFVSGRIGRALAGEEGAAALCRALLTGDRAGIAPAARRDFERAGASHLLAVSGMHLSVLVGGLAFLLRLFPLGRKVRVRILLVFADFYCLLAGLSPSVLRAAFMLGWHELARAVGRRGSPPGALVSAAAFLLFCSPGAASSVSFWLSVFATFGVLFALSLGERREKKKAEKEKRPLFFRAVCRVLFAFLLLPLSVGIFASLAVLPVTSLVFGRISLLAPVTTLLCTPLLEGTLLLAAAAALLGAPFAPLAGAASFLSGVFYRLIAALSSLRGVYLSLAYPFFPVAAALFLLSLVCLFPLSVRRRRLGAVLLSVLFLSGSAAGIALTKRAERDLLLCAVLPMEKGETILFSSPEGVCAASYGRGIRSAAQGEALSSGLSLLHAAEAEHYLISDAPTAARARALLRAADRVLIRNVWLPEEWKDPALGEELAARGSAVRYYRPGEPLSFGDTLFLPQKNAPAPGRALSGAALSVSSGGARILYLSAGVSESPDLPRRRETAREADLVILGTAGPAASNPLALPLPSGTELCCVGEAGERLAPALRERAETVLFGEGRRFALKREEKNAENEPLS